MVRSSEGGGLLIIGWLLALRSIGAGAQLEPDYGCPPQERILPCRCSTRDMEIQIWQVDEKILMLDERIKSRQCAEQNVISLPINLRAGAAIASYQKC